MPEYSVPSSGTCEECGFDWSLSWEDARGLIAGVHERIAVVLEGRDGTRPPAENVWSPVGYVSHLVDALRSWGERIAALAHDPTLEIVPFDQDEMARVRGYRRLPQAGAMWALEHAVREYGEALHGADLSEQVRHPEFSGDSRIGDFVRWIAHEVHHHELDIRRGLGVA